MAEIIAVLIIAPSIYAPIAMTLLWAGQEIATARIDSAKELGQTDLSFATLLLDFTVFAAESQPFTWFFTRSIRRRHIDRFAPGAMMPVRFNPLDGTPSPRPVHFRAPNYRRPARLWLIRGFRVWLIAAIVSITFAALVGLGAGATMSTT